MGSHILLVEYLKLTDCEELLEPRDRDSVLVGDSIRLRYVDAAIKRLAPSDHPILLLGETGVGKERAAEEIHRVSGREGPFIPINCAAIPQELAESELFGHAAGSFTGAKRPHGGLFRAAEGGTLFLDEFGDLPSPLQAKLLRVLATGEIRAVGDTNAKWINTRVVAATNINLEKATRDGKFRHDLYSRLAGFQIQIPPLRERRPDILYLAQELGGLKMDSLTADAAEALLIYTWPYNVRELIQTARAVVHHTDSDVDLHHLPDAFSISFAHRFENQQIPLGNLPEALMVRRDRKPNADELRTVLRHFEGNIAKTASFFGKDRRQIYRWAERLKVEVDDFR